MTPAPSLLHLGANVNENWLRGWLSDKGSEQVSISRRMPAYGFSEGDAKAIVAYRDKVKGFKSLEDMKAVPNVDAKKIDAKKDQLVFGAGVTKP